MKVNCAEQGTIVFVGDLNHFTNLTKSSISSYNCGYTIQQSLSKVVSDFRARSKALKSLIIFRQDSNFAIENFYIINE